MFQTIYQILHEILITEKAYLESGASFSVPGWAYYLVAVLGLVLYLGFQVMLYFFMGIGIKHIYEKKGLKKTCFIWIPILQFYALIKAYGEVKIFNIEKAKYALYLVIVGLIYFLGAFALDIYYYAGDICYFLVHGQATLPSNLGMNDWVYYIYDTVELVYEVSLLLAVIPFFKERTKNSFWLSVLCFFVPDIFPIFVFAFRKRDSQNFGQYKVVYTNYGNYEKGGANTTTTTKVEEPFADFSQKTEKADYSEPFADFSNQQTQENTENIAEQTSQDYSEIIKEEDDDLFN